MWDAVLLNIESNTFGLSLIYYALIFNVYPGGDPVIASTLAALGCVPVAIAYASLSTAMPRSGGDYVFISRTLHPAMGVASALSISVWFFFFTGTYINWVFTVGVATALQVAGSVLGNATILGVASLASEPVYVIVFGSLLILVFGTIAIRSSRLAFKTLNVFVVLGLLGVFLWIILLGLTSRDTFVSLFNAYSSRYTNDTDYYHTIIKTAQQGGFNPSTGFNLTALVGMVPFAAYIYPYLAAQSAVGGEVKNPGKNFFSGLLINLLISAAMVGGATWALDSAAGYNFIMAADYVFVNGLNYPLPTPPYFTLFAGVATTNLLLQALMAIGFIAWCLGIPLINMIQVPRFLLAMSFDRILPGKFADIGRFGTPWVGLLLTAVASEVMLIIYTVYANVLATVSAILGSIAATFMVACIAAAVFPFRKQTKPLYENAPKLAALKIAGFPVVSLAGILGTLFLGWVSIEYATNPVYAANNAPSLLSVAGIYVVGIVVYFAAKAYRKRQGLDIARAVTQIPPE